MIAATLSAFVEVMAWTLASIWAAGVILSLVMIYWENRHISLNDFWCSLGWPMGIWDLMK